MTHSFDIRFDPDPLIDDVVFAVAPIDAFTGRIVRRSVTARVKDLPDRPIRNLTGLLVFINLPTQPLYTVEVSPEAAAGYFNPGEQTWPVPGDTSKRLVVPLLRRPTDAVDREATTVAGVVVRGVQPAADVIIQAILPPAFLPPGTTPDPFETRSDERGAFALRLRLPADPLSVAIDVVFRFDDGTSQRELERAVDERKFYSFEEPIDLTGSNEPPLVPFGG